MTFYFIIKETGKMKKQSKHNFLKHSVNVFLACNIFFFFFEKKKKPCGVLPKVNLVFILYTRLGTNVLSIKVY